MENAADAVHVATVLLVVALAPNNIALPLHVALLDFTFLDTPPNVTDAFALHVALDGIFAIPRILKIADPDQAPLLFTSDFPTAAKTA